MAVEWSSRISGKKKKKHLSLLSWFAKVMFLVNYKETLEAEKNLMFDEICITFPGLS